MCLGLHLAVLDEQLEAMKSQVEENIEMLDLASDQYKVRTGDSGSLFSTRLETLRCWTSPSVSTRLEH